MSNAKHGDIPQEELDKTLARALGAPPMDRKFSFSVHRVMCHKARVSDLPADAATSVTVHDEIVGCHAELGSLVSTNRVGPFTVRLVRGREDASDVWQIVETICRDARVVILTYGSGDRARDVATRYAAVATEVDLASDFHPAAHFFGESRSR